METHVLMWLLGGFGCLWMVTLGWTKGGIEEERRQRQAMCNRISDELNILDSRVRVAISRPEASELIDLKLKPLQDSLDRNTMAVERLASILISKEPK